MFYIFFIHWHFWCRDTFLLTWHVSMIEKILSRAETFFKIWIMIDAIFIISLFICIHYSRWYVYEQFSLHCIWISHCLPLNVTKISLRPAFQSRNSNFKSFLKKLLKRERSQFAQVCTTSSIFHWRVIWGFYLELIWFIVFLHWKMY